MEGMLTSVRCKSFFVFIMKEKIRNDFSLLVRGGVNVGTCSIH